MAHSPTFTPVTTPRLETVHIFSSVVENVTAPAPVPPVKVPAVVKVAATELFANTRSNVA